MPLAVKLLISEYNVAPVSSVVPFLDPKLNFASASFKNILAVYLWMAFSSDCLVRCGQCIQCINELHASDAPDLHHLGKVRLLLALF